MNKQPLSDNACYAFTRVAVPISFNNTTRFLGFESSVHNDVTLVKYRFYSLKGLYWYSIILTDGHVANSLFFIGLSNCVRDFRALCGAMDWVIEDSVGLSNFVSQYNKTHHERSI